MIKLYYIFISGNGQVYVRTNPAVEYDYTYTIGVCIHSRRQDSCATMTINFGK
jgi:hypothetical protein